MTQDHPEKVVRISLNPSGSPVPDQDPVIVRKDSQKVKWTAAFPFKIEVDGYSDLAHGSDGGDGQHHCKTGFFGEARKHKYSITANGVTNDPELDVKP